MAPARHLLDYLAVVGEADSKRVGARALHEMVEVAAAVSEAGAGAIKRQARREHGVQLPWVHPANLLRLADPKLTGDDVLPRAILGGLDLPPVQPGDGETVTGRMQLLGERIRRDL